MDDITLDETLQPRESTVAFLKMFARMYRVDGCSSVRWDNEYLN